MGVRLKENRKTSDLSLLEELNVELFVMKEKFIQIVALRPSTYQQTLNFCCKGALRGATIIGYDCTIIKEMK